MLILTRKPGQSIQIGASLLVVTRIERTYVKVRIDGLDYQFSLDKKTDSKIGADTVTLLFTKNGYHVDVNSVKIGIQAPSHVNIVRTELLNKGFDRCKARN